MNLLITGATGFLGSHLARTFLADGHTITCAIRSSSNSDRLADIADRLRFFELDRNPLDSLFRGAPPFDAIIHAATCYGRRGESAWEIFSANTAFPMQLLDCGIRHRCGLFLNTDTSLHQALNAYALSKKQFADWGAFAAGSGIRFINLILEHFYGPDDAPGKVTTHLIRGCLKNEPSIALTLGEQQRDFIFISDVVSAFRTILRAANEIETFPASFAIGSGAPVAIRSLAELIHRLTGSTTRLDFGAVPYRQHETMLSRADISEMLRLGWRPIVGLEDGLRRTIEHERAKGLSS